MTYPDRLNSNSVDIAGVKPETPVNTTGVSVDLILFALAFCFVGFHPRRRDAFVERNRGSRAYSSLLIHGARPQPHESRNCPLWKGCLWYRCLFCGGFRRHELRKENYSLRVAGELSHPLLRIWMCSASKLVLNRPTSAFRPLVHHIIPPEDKPPFLTATGRLMWSDHS